MFIILWMVWGSDFMYFMVSDIDLFWFNFVISNVINWISVWWVFSCYIWLINKIVVGFNFGY